MLDLMLLNFDSSILRVVLRLMISTLVNVSLLVRLPLFLQAFKAWLAGARIFLQSSPYNSRRLGKQPIA